MSLDAVLGAAERPQIVYPGLSRWRTPSEWDIRPGVIQVHPPSASSVGKAAGIRKNIASLIRRGIS